MTSKSYTWGGVRVELAGSGARELWVFEKSSRHVWLSSEPFEDSLVLMKGMDYHC